MPYIHIYTRNKKYKMKNKLDSKICWKLLLLLLLLQQWQYGNNNGLKQVEYLTCNCTVLSARSNIWTQFSDHRVHTFSLPRIWSWVLCLFEEVPSWWFIFSWLFLLLLFFYSQVPLSLFLAKETSHWKAQHSQALGFQFCQQENVALSEATYSWASYLISLLK